MIPLTWASTAIYHQAHIVTFGIFREIFSLCISFESGKIKKNRRNIYLCGRKEYTYRFTIQTLGPFYLYAFPAWLNVLASLGNTERRVVLGHTLNTHTRKLMSKQKGFKKINDFVLGHIHSHPVLHAARGLRAGHPCQRL